MEVNGYTEITPGDMEPPASEIPSESRLQGTTQSWTLEDKIDALLVLNGIDPQTIEEGGIEAVKRAVGRGAQSA